MKQTLIFLLIFSFTAAVNAEGTENLRLRLSWSGENTAVFGEVSCDAGPLSTLTSLSMDAECPGGAWLVNGKVQIRQTTPKTSNGFDVTVPWRPDARLYVQIGKTTEFTREKRVEIPLQQLLTGEQKISLSETNSRLQYTVTRVPGDSLRVEMSSDNLVFSPRDMFQCTVHPMLVSSVGMTESKGNTAIFANETGELEYVVFRGRETFEVHRGKVNGVLLNGTVPVEVQFPVPESEGVYDVILRLHRNSRENGVMESLKRPLAAPFTGNHSSAGSIVAERRIQFIVLTEDSDSRTDSGETSKYTLKYEIDSSNPVWWEGLEHSQQKQFHTVFPNLTPLQSPQRQTHSAGSWKFLEIPQSQTPQTAPAWEAFPLLVENPGLPHVLEVEYLTNQEQTFSVSILEPDSTGTISPPGVDSGVNVPAPLVEGEGSAFHLDRHHVIFWPQSRNPIVLIVNRHAKKSVCLGKIRLYAAGNHLNSLSGVSVKNRRLMALLLDKPMFPQFFSSSEINNDSTGVYFPDWLTFYESGNRMIEYMEHVGYNGLFLTVYSEGSSIYPSRILAPTPYFDAGIFSRQAQDPCRKDVLEMLLRMFDRKNLTLIPAMDFSAPVPDLETAVHFPHAAELQGRFTTQGTLRWKNPAGLELTQQKTSLKNGAPYYNILNPMVQESVLRALAELTRRYGHHPSFGGVSLQLHANSFLVLPGSQWGMDPESIAQFARETGTRLDGDFSEQVRFLTNGAGKSLWIQWRADRMTLFYRRAAALLSSIPDAKLYLNGTNLFSLETHPELMPKLDGIQTAEETFLHFGLDVKKLETVPNIVVSRPQKILVNRPVAEQAGDLQWAQMPGTYRIFQKQKSPCTVFYHEPESLRLEAFDAVSPFKPAFAQLTTTYAQTTAEARRPYAEALAMLDAFTMIQGGQSPVWGKEEALRGTIYALSQLPAIHFSSAMSSTMGKPNFLPVIFRVGSLPNENYAYAVNTSAFKLKARVYIQPSMNQATQQSNPASPQAIHLENGTSVQFARDSHGMYWEVVLAPYQIEVIRFPGSPVMLLDPECEIPPEAQLVFQQEFLRLQKNLESLKNPTFYLGLKNPGFESGTSNTGEIPFWTVRFPQPDFSVASQPQFQTISQSASHTVMNHKNSTESPSWEFLAANLDSSPNHPETSTENSISTAILDSSNSMFGENTLCMKTDGKPIQIVSNPFVVNPTGRLAIHFWIRTERIMEDVPLRLIVNGKTTSGTFTRTIPLTVEQNIGPEWVQQSVHLNDLPLEKEMVLSLGFELYEAGCVWLDNIQLSDIQFSETEIQQLGRIFAQFQNRIVHNELAPCTSTLECYWMRFLKENLEINTPPASEPLAQNKPRTNQVIKEYVPEKTGPQIPHLGQLPTLPSLPKLPPPPKFPLHDSGLKQSHDFEKESDDAEKESYLKKMKNLLPW